MALLTGCTSSAVITPTPTPTRTVENPPATQAPALTATPTPTATPRSQVLTRIPIAGIPQALVLDTLNRRAYVRTADSVVAVDIDSLAVVDTVRLPDGTLPGGVALDRTYDTIYTSDLSGGLRVISTSLGRELTEVAHLELPPLLGPVAVDEGTHRVFVLDVGVVGADPEPRAGRLHVVNGNTRSLIATIPLGGHPTSIAVSSATGRVYVSEHPPTPGASGLVRVFDADTLREVTTIGVSPGGSLVLDEATNTLYMTATVEAAGRQITFINGRTASAATFFPAAAVAATVIGIDAARGHLYLAGLDGLFQIGHLRPGNPRPGFFSEGRHELGGEPAGIAADPSTRRVFVALRSGELV
ncbi:MAG: YncE family protein, partial [Candidatus Limnocylindria bacterium]